MSQFQCRQCRQCKKDCCVTTIKFGLVAHHSVRCPHCGDWFEAVTVNANASLFESELEKMRAKFVTSHHKEKLRFVIATLETMVYRSQIKPNLMSRRNALQERIELQRINRESWDEY